MVSFNDAFDANAHISINRKYIDLKDYLSSCFNTESSVVRRIAIIINAPICAMHITPTHPKLPQRLRVSNLVH